MLELQGAEPQHARCRGGAAGAAARAGYALLTLLAACHTDTRGLERRATEAAGGSGGSAGASALGQLPSDGAAGNPNRDGNDAGTRGPGMLSILHGLADGGRLFICLRDSATGQELPRPNTVPEAGLPFGASARLVLDWDLAARSVETELYAARDGALATLGFSAEPTCSELRTLAGSARVAAQRAAGDAGTDAGGTDAAAGEAGVVEPAPNGLVQLGSVSLAAGALHVGGQYALVATGCAAVVADGFADQSCGPLDALSGARLSELLVEFGQGPMDDQHFGLQYLNANRALARADVSLDPLAPSSPPVTLASQVPFGALRPRIPAALDAPLAVELHGAGNGDANTYLQNWSETLSGSGLDGTQTGLDYLLVSLGANPGSDEVALRGAGLSPPRLAVLAPASGP